MKLYKLSQSRNSGWYTYDSAIVAANSKDEARTLIPSPFYFYDDDAFYYKYKNQEPRVEAIDPSWCHPRYVKVMEIGTSDETEPCVILGSFKSGFDESRYLDMRRIGRDVAGGKMSESTVRSAIETLKRLELQLHDQRLAELRYHLIEANRVHNLKQVQEYELKIRDYMNEEYEDWS